MTGRSRNADDSPYGGTVAETAALVAGAGGRGVPMVVDHGDDEAVAELFAAVGREQGKLDILVNNAAKVTGVSGPFWTERPAVADLLTVGLRSHYIAAFHAAPLMIAGGRGLIVHTGHYGAVSYHQGPAYGAQKAGADKMAADMARELRPHHVAAVSIWMGGLDTERVRAHADALPPETRDVRRESPEFTGRVIAALYRSPELMTLSGRTLIGAELGAHLGVTDFDGSVPVSYRDTLGAPPEPHASLR